jgi:hypothetical protein
MPHAADCTSPAGASGLDRSTPVRVRDGSAGINVGYILFALGALWIMAIAGILATAPK